MELLDVTFLQVAKAGGDEIVKGCWFVTMWGPKDEQLHEQEQSPKRGRGCLGRGVKMAV
jgi:hypothetical protein